MNNLSSVPRIPTQTEVFSTEDPDNTQICDQFIVTPQAEANGGFFQTMINAIANFK